MKNKIKYFLICALFFSCSNKQEKNGLIETRSENGSLKKLEFFENQKNDGIYANFHENGRLYTLGIYKKDSIRNGPSVIFYNNGQINTYDFFINDKQEGLSLLYNKQGVLKEKWNYENGVRNGKQYSFDEKGDTLNIEIYENGTLKSSD